MGTFTASVHPGDANPASTTRYAFGNGYKMAEQLRHVPRQQPLTFVALSGLGQDEDKRHAKAGFDVHFTKSVDIPALNKLLASIAAERPGRPVEPEE